jgi:hypothetical protein
MSSQYIVKISDIEFPDCVDSSRTGFTIWHPVAATLVPELGQTVMRFNYTGICLSAFVVVADTVSVTYYPFEKPKSDTLPSGITGLLNCHWEMNSRSVSFIGGLISVKIPELPSGAAGCKGLVWLMRSKDGNSWINIGGILSGDELTSTTPVINLSDFAIGITDNQSAAEMEAAIPAEYSLSQNYPNPFNPSTKIQYQLPEAGYVTIKVYDMLGRQAACIADCRKAAGFHTASFDAGNLPSGVYIYEIAVNKYRAAKKMLLLK